MPIINDNIEFTLLSQHTEDLTQREFNELIRQALWDEGDNGLVPRNVRHFAYPQSGDAVCSFKNVTDYLSIHNLKVTETFDNTGLMFEHESEVSSFEFDVFTYSLKTKLFEKGWVYDSWECLVVKPQTLH